MEGELIGYVNRSFQNDRSGTLNSKINATTGNKPLGVEILRQKEAPMTLLTILFKKHQHMTLVPHDRLAGGRELNEFPNFGLFWGRAMRGLGYLYKRCGLRE